MATASTVTSMFTSQANLTDPLTPPPSATSSPTLSPTSMTEPTLPSFPEDFLEDPSDEATIPAWIEAAKQRQKHYEKYFEKSLEIQARVRQEIVRILDENDLLQDALVQAQRDLLSNRSKITELESKVKDLSAKSTNQIRLIEDLAEENRSLKRRVRAAEDAFAEVEKEKELIQATVAEKMCGIRERMKRRVVELFGKKERQLVKEKTIYKGQINKIKEVLANETPTGASTLFSPVFPKKLYEKRNYSKEHSRHRHVRNSDVVLVPIMELDEGEEEQRVEAEKVDQNDTSGLPVVNPRHECSLKTGNDLWIDHRPDGTALDLGTVMRPAIKNSKEVTSLKTSDFISSSSKKTAASKYALLHHCASSHGSVKTQVFKGDVIPSSTGGAQVIFNDVETLRQQSPTSNHRPRRKRLGETIDASPTTTTTRYSSSKHKKCSLTRLLKRSRRR